jgi:sporulation protein YlmC with PRC-barrel domain
MHALKLVRLIGTLTMVAATPVVLAVAAHAQAPATSPTEVMPGSPPVARPELPNRPQQVDPGRPATPTAPSTIDQKPAMGATGRTPTAPGTQAATDPKKDAMVGLPVFGSDGQKVGEVRDVKAATDGKVEAIHVKTGGLLGFGGKTVAIPAGKFNQSGQNVQLALTSDDVAKLPKLDEKPS